MGGLSADQIARWRHDGFLSPSLLLDAGNIPPHVRPAGSVRPAAMLVRGTDRYGHFELVEPAKAELDPESLAVHERAVGLYRDLYIEEEARHALLPAGPA